MVNYNEGKIYKIESNCDHDEEDIYIGSTTKKYLSQRMDEYRSKYRQWKEGKYNFTRSFALFEKYGVENCEIILIENVNANSKDELTAREAYYIKALQCVNRVIPLRTKSEYREDNREHISQYNKQYNKQYREDNIEQRRNYDKIHYQQNKEIINRKCNCICGSIFSHHHKKDHERSKKHQLFIQNNPTV